MADPKYILDVWENDNYDGAHVRFTSAYALLQDGWNDKISSIKVVKGNWKVCRGENFQDCRTLKEGNEYPTMWQDWNDKISSIVPLDSNGNEDRS